MNAQPRESIAEMVDQLCAAAVAIDSDPPCVLCKPGDPCFWHRPSGFAATGKEVAS